MRKTAFLHHFGLDKKTEAAYRALLSLADAPASHIARRAGIKRTSIYHILENLVAMGLTSSYQEQGVRRFAAEHPAKLKIFFERQAILAERVIPELEKEMLRSKSHFLVRVFEGQDAVRSMTEAALKAKEKTILSIGSSKRLLGLLGGKYGFGERRRAQGIFQRSLRFAEDAPIDSPTRLHEIRILPSSFSFPGYCMIFDTTILLIPFEEPARGILITDSVCSLMMRTLFSALWDSFGRNL